MDIQSVHIKKGFSNADGIAIKPKVVFVDGSARMKNKNDEVEAQLRRNVALARTRLSVLQKEMDSIVNIIKSSGASESNISLLIANDPRLIELRPSLQSLTNIYNSAKKSLTDYLSSYVAKQKLIAEDLRSKLSSSQDDYSLLEKERLKIEQTLGKKIDETEAKYLKQKQQNKYLMIGLGVVVLGFVGMKFLKK